MPTDPDTKARLFRRVGVIDIGSNSVRLVIFDLFGAAFTPIYNEKVLAGLGRELHKTGRLDPEGARRAFAALRRFKYLTQAQNIGEVAIAATAALRDAEDAQAFIDKVRDEIGFNIEPLSGEQEAYVSTMGVLAGESRAEGIAADLGGASLELMRIQGGEPQKGNTYPLGPFSVYQGAFDVDELRPKLEAASQQFDGVELGENQMLYLVGGAWRNLALVHQKMIGYPLKIAHNFYIGVQEARALGVWASTDGVDELLLRPDLSKRRAETLPYAGLLLQILIDRLKPSGIVIAPGGLRDGMVYSTFSEEIRKRDALFDACRDLARGRQQNRLFGKPLINFLSDIGDDLPMAFEADNEMRLRKAACYLVGIGKGIHPDHRAKMTFKTVLYAPLPSLTHKERAYLAMILYASYTSRARMPNSSTIDYFLTEEDQLSARIYGAAMRLGVVLSGRSAEILSRQSLSLVDNKLQISVDGEYEGLVVERCLIRLRYLAELAGFEV